MTDKMISKRYYALADMLLIRLKSDGLGKRASGKLTWSPPWGGSMVLNEETTFKVTKEGTLHILLKMPGDLMLYAAADSLDTHMVVLDQGKETDVTRIELTDVKNNVTDQITGFGSAVVAYFAKQHGSNEWQTVKKAVAA